MSIINLKSSAPPTAATTPFRNTAAQDVMRASSPRAWYRRKILYVIAGAVVGGSLLLAWIAHDWMQSAHVVSRQSLEIATVTRGSFVRDVLARGTVIAAISPSLFATAAATVRYAVHAGDRVTEGQVLAHLSSPDLGNEYQRELATLDSMDAALARQKVELRQHLLMNQQRADLAAVEMNAALRELQREQAAWKLHVISERRQADLRRTLEGLGIRDHHPLHSADRVARNAAHPIVEPRARGGQQWHCGPAGS